MQIARSDAELEKIINGWRKEKRRIALVPTMGALHDGHLSLVRTALDNANKCVVSVFVNPTQFAPDEDFAAYPRDEKGDLEKLEATGVHLVFLPQEKELYPIGPISDLEAGPAAAGLESVSRPHFFNGVVSVVARLFDRVRPDVAVFGEKDYQQLCVIRQMTKELNLETEIIGALTARDEEGLALSSRNAYLSDTELKIARRLNKILFSIAEQVRKSPGEAREIVPTGAARLREAGFDAVDYIELCDAETLKPLNRLSGAGRLLAAARIGKTRLIDNVAV